MRTVFAALVGALVLVAATASGQPAPVGRAEVPAPGQLPCEELVDRLDDGTVDVRVHYEYGDDGRLESVETEGSGEGSLHEHLSYAYDGRRMRREAIDSDADGAVDAVFELEYDRSGRLVGELWQAPDSAPERVHYTYTASGQVLTEVVDVGDDGVADQIISYTYGEVGLIAVDEDLDADGVAEWRVRYRYDPNDRWMIEEWRSDSGDELRARTTYRYDTGGRLLETILDEGDDGVVDARSRYIYDCWDR